MAIPKTLVDYGVYVRDKGKFGIIDLKLPDITIKTEDFSAGGIGSTVKIDCGIVEAIYVEFMLPDYDEDLMSLFGVSAGGYPYIEARGVERDNRGQDQAIRVEMQGLIYKFDSGSWKRGERPDIKATMNCQYYSLSVNGRVLHQINAETNQRVIDGVDQNAAARQILGQ